MSGTKQCLCGLLCPDSYSTHRRICHVYFAKSRLSGLIKIGVSTDPRSRLRNLDSATPGGIDVLAVVRGDRSHESTLHTLFATARVNGEWFEPVEALDRHIERLAQCDPYDRERFLTLPSKVPMTREETAEMFKRVHQNLIKEKAA